jgi:hypothetical protein
MGVQKMRRRAFVKSSLATAIAATLPTSRLFAQAPTTVLSDINVVTHTGGTKVIEKAVLKELQASLSGQILLPTSEGYDSARKVWNGMIDKKPALIVQVANETDIQNAINIAREYQTLTSIKGGGHNVAGKGICEGGLAIDCSLMAEATCDPINRSATAQPGVLLGAVDRATQPYDLATPAGVVSHTGAAGLTLGGGFGKLSRIHGLTCDNVRSIEIVTPDGEIRRATINENADLFWGLRGGGGNFGVATKFEYQCHEVGTDFLAGSIMHPLSAAGDILNAYGELIETVPWELELSCNTIIMPNGKGFINLSAFYGGDPAEGEKVLAPIRAIGKPVMDDIKIGKYLDIQSRIDRNVPWGQQYYQKAGMLTEIKPEMVDLLVDITKESWPVQIAINMTQVGGAINEIDPGVTAYPNRNAEVQMILSAAWPKRQDEQGDYVAAVRKHWKKLVPYTDGVYINNMFNDDGDARVIENWSTNYSRLVELKNKYDPMNLLRLNANIKPTV